MIHCLRSLYYNSGAFGFPNGVATSFVGWIGPDDPSIRAEAMAQARRVAPPYEQSLADLAARAWETIFPGPVWVMPALGPSQDEFNRRLARADGLQAEPDPKLGGAITLVRPSLAGPERLPAAQRAIADQRASFEAFAAQRGLNARSLTVTHAADEHSKRGAEADT